MQFLTFLLLSLTTAVAAEFVEIPSSQNVVENGNLMVHCAHNGAVSITWTVNGSVISDNSLNFRIMESRDGAVLNSTLTLDPISHTIHTGSYQCLAALNSSEETTNFTITVMYLDDTVLIQQVSDECSTTADGKVIVGSTIMLNCTPPDARPVANISWFKDEMELLQQDVSDIMFGIDKRLLTISDIQVMNAGDYHCRASNEVGEQRSEDLRILVVPTETTVTIFDSDSILYAKEFDQAFIVCRIKPTPDSSNVRWDHIPSDNIRSGVNGYVLWSDMCDYTLQINNVTTDREGSYRCRHTDGIDDSRTLKIARLSPEYKVQQVPGPPIGISRSVTLRCTHAANEGNVVPTYGWTFLPREGGNPVAVMSEAGRVTVSDGTLEISSTRESDSGLYTCKVNHTLVAICPTASVNLTIEAPPSARIETDIHPSSVMLNTDVTLRCIGTSQHTLQFAWTISDRNNPVPTNSPLFSIVSSTITSTLTINNITEHSLGTYFCSVNDTFSLLVFENVTLVETENLYLLGGVSYVAVNVPNGTVMELECPLRRGIGNIMVGWYKGSGHEKLQDGENGVEIRSLPSGSSVLEVNPMLLANESVYLCAATDETQAVVGLDFNVTVTLPVDIVSSPPPIINGTEGQKMQFNCKVTGRPTPTVTWLYDTENIQELNDDRVNNLGNGTLVIEPLAREHSGTYYCAVQGEGNNLIIKEFRLQVLPEGTGPTTETQSSDDGFHFGSLNSNESILLVTVCSVVIILLILSLLVLLSLLGCWCWFLRQKRTYTVTMEEENGEFKRQASGRGSLRKDNSGVLVQSTSTNYFGDAIEMTFPSEYNSYGNYSHPPSLPLTPFGQGSIISEPLQHSPTPPAPSPIPHGTLGTTSLYSGEDEHSLAANLPNFPRANLRLKEEMGEGEFGPVYRGLAKNILPNEEATQVAVKVLLLRGGGEGEEHLRPDLALLDFANQMKLEYSNIATILGMCTDMEPYYIIYEYLDQGDLKKFLMNSRPTLSEEPPRLTQQNLRRIILQVADGMAYLFSQRIIHGDLATRNCLISSDLRVKIADLGIGHDLYSGDYYDNGAQLLPIRWMPTELLVSCDEGPSFSLHSDIWSFGVFCWEVFTFARLPYEDLDDLQVLEMVPKGELLPFPLEGCPSPLYSIMKECWRETPDERPRFAKLCVEIIDIELD